MAKKQRDAEKEVYWREVVQRHALTEVHCEELGSLTSNA